MEDSGEVHEASSASSNGSTPLFASSRQSTPDLQAVSSDNERYSTASTSPSTSSTCSSVSRQFLRSPDPDGDGYDSDHELAAAGPSAVEARLSPGFYDLSDIMDSSDDEFQQSAGTIFRPARRRRLSDDDPRYDVFPKCPRPSHLWSPLLELNRLQLGGKPQIYRRKCYGNLFMAERLELMAKLEGHSGCVNSVNFNANGDRLVSGSDDLHVMMWEWQSNKLLTSFKTSHRGNIFQSKFMPHRNDLTIITSSNDGAVRLHQLDEAGSGNVDSRKICYHRGPVHKIDMHPAEQGRILSCGEDGCVFNIDIRSPNPEKLMTVKDASEEIVNLYSIAIHPLRPAEFITSGTDQFVRIYDLRNLKPDECVREKCPNHLRRVERHLISVSCAVYNFDGTEILATYADEDIYIFPNDPSSIAAETTGKSYINKYRGRRDRDTVKGVNYFGRQSEYIVSGSDCGHIFLWDKKTAHIVNFLYGDEECAVNTVEPNPCAPFLATSGFDHNVKIWAPSADEEPNLSELRDHTIQNMRQREQNIGIEYAPDHRRRYLYLMNLMPGGPPGFLPPGFLPPRLNASSSDDESPDRLQRCSTS